jgi:APA family basic amino acid/polyamine antiporter
MDIFRSAELDFLQQPTHNTTKNRTVGRGWDMALIRAIGRWALAGLAINVIIGGGIFGLPGELNRLLGPASPLALIAGAIAMGIMMACAAEVGSQFPVSGGTYTYVRQSFGRFAGLQAAWFHLLAAVGGVAAVANVFVSYLGGMLPALAEGWARGLTTAVLIAIPMTINCLGVRRGAALSSVFAIAKLLPLAILIVLGLGHSMAHASVTRVPDVAAPGWATWFTALLAVQFAYAGWEDVLVPCGEVQEPRRTLPFALTVGLLGSALIYTLLQYVTVNTIGSAATEHPLADVASLLMGSAGWAFVSVGAMLSTYGFIAGAFVSVPRLPYSLAAEGDAPPFFATLHPRFRTPVYAIVGFAIVSWVLAATGSFLWALALSAGSTAIVYAGNCASLIQLRRVRPHADAVRVPFGRALAIAGIVVCATLLAQLDGRHALLMLLTASLAAGNWLWATRQTRLGRWRAAAGV